MRFIFKIIFFNLFILFVLLVVTELTLRTFDIHRPHLAQLQYATDSFSKNDEEFLEKQNYFFHSKIFQATPFIGVTYNSALDGKSKFGLNHLPEKNEDDCFIGIFGGSVAEQLALHIIHSGTDYNTPIKNKVKKCKNKNITWINLAGGAFKQPYQYVAMSLLAESLDIAINVDGFNEVYLDPGANYPAFFPYFTSELFYLSDKKVEILTQLKSLKLRNLNLVKIIIDHPIFLNSATFATITSRVHSHTNSKIKELRKELRMESGNNNIDTMTSTQRIQKRVQAWAKFSKMQYVVANSLNIPTLFVLQPNVHDKGSKTLSKEEQELVKNVSQKRDHQALATSYSLLRQSAVQMKAQGIPILDLSMAFKSEKEQIYTDSCCHINTLGNNLLAQKLVNALIANCSK